MTIAYVKNADGSGGIVQNTFRDAAGTLHTLLSDYYTDDPGVQHLIFRDQLFTAPLRTARRVYHTTDIRKFIATIAKDLLMTCSAVMDDFCAVKDPNEILDYTIDYSDVLAESDPPDSIASSSWVLTLHALETTLAIDDGTQFTGIDATCWISGGNRTGLGHKLTNTIVCASGRVYERTIDIWIKSK